MKKPTINPAFQALIPPLQPEELARLEAEILADGCRDPLVTWKGVLVDGHNRMAICQKHGKFFEVVEKSFADELDAMIWIRQHQIGRRNLSDDQRAMNAAGLAELEAQRSKRDRAKAAVEAREVKAGRKEPETILAHTSDAKIEPKSRTPRAEEKAAQVASVSVRQVKRAQSVLKASPVMAAAVVAGSMSLAAAVRETKRAEVVANLEDVGKKEAKAVAGVYDVVVIDPPWPMEKIERDERPNQSAFDYPTMSEEEIGKVAPPVAGDAHVWLWTTHRFLPMAFRLLEKWGLKYVCAFVWHKTGGMQPIGLPQFNCEFALYARKGSPKFIDTKAFPVCFEAVRGKHSEKPEEFYAVVRRVTAGRRLDMFGRRAILGFDSWGKEAA